MNPMFQFLIVHLCMFVYWRDSTVPSMNKPAQLSMKTDNIFVHTMKVNGVHSCFTFIAHKQLLERHEGRLNDNILKTTLKTEAFSRHIFIQTLHKIWNPSDLVHRIIQNTFLDPALKRYYFAVCSNP